MIETGNVILDKSFNFALDIISYCETLDERRKYVISNQLLRSGTSVGVTLGNRKIAKAELILSTK